MTLKELLSFEFTINEDGKMIALVPLSRVNEIADILTNQKERIDKAIDYIKECEYHLVIQPQKLLEILGDKE